MISRWVLLFLIRRFVYRSPALAFHDNVFLLPRVAGGGIHGLFNCRGEEISSQAPPSCNMAIWWDADVLRELLDGTKIDKWNYASATTTRLLSAHNFGCAANNGTKANPCLYADIFGDWREEVIWRTSDSSALRIYTSAAVTNVRIFTLMHDPMYRVAIAWQNTAYNQPPHPSFFLGDGMSIPPQPKIYVP